MQSCSGRLVLLVSNANTLPDLETHGNHPTGNHTYGFMTEMEAGTFASRGLFPVQEHVGLHLPVNLYDKATAWTCTSNRSPSHLTNMNPHANFDIWTLQWYGAKHCWSYNDVAPVQDRKPGNFLWVLR